MPKGRHLKPEFFTDRHIVSVSPLARLLYQGLWCYAADCGHLDDEPFELKMRILPADNCDVEELLGELSGTGRIERKDGAIYLPKLSDHARIDKRYETVCERCKTRREHTEQAASQPPHPTVTTQGSRREPTVTTCAHPPQHDADGDGDGDGDGEVMVMSPSRELALPDASRTDVERICEHLADRIEANGAKRPTIGKRWRDAARLMLDADKRTEDEVHGAIDWCQSDGFWRANILSLPKLREKYDQLRLQAQRKSGGTSRTEEWRSMQERQMARAIEREREMGIQR